MTSKPRFKKGSLSITTTDEGFGASSTTRTLHLVNIPCETNLNELSTEQIMQLVSGLFPKPSAGPSPSPEGSKKPGSASTPESENGTVELSVTYNLPGQFEINLGTASYTLTDRITYFPKGSRGFRNLPWPLSVVAQLFDLAKTYPGSTFSYKYTTPSSSNYPITEVLQRALRELENPSQCKYPILTP